MRSEAKRGVDSDKCRVEQTGVMDSNQCREANRRGGPKTCRVEELGEVKREIYTD